MAGDLLGYWYLHDISHDDTVYKLWCYAPCSKGSFGCMLSQICCTVISQHTTISTKRSALGSYNKYTCSGKKSILVQRQGVQRTQHWATSHHIRRYWVVQFKGRPINWFGRLICAGRTFSFLNKVSAEGGSDSGRCLCRLHQLTFRLEFFTLRDNNSSKKNIASSSFKCI